MTDLKMVEMLAQNPQARCISKFLKGLRMIAITISRPIPLMTVAIEK